MKVVFLCGGVGRRMFPVTEDKFLLNFLGKTLLQHQMETAREAGFDRCVIIGNPTNMQQITEIARTLNGVQIELALQREARGIADALKSAQPFLTGNFVVVSPNDVFAVSAYTRLLQEHATKPATSYLLACEVNSYFPGGYLVVDSAKELKSIVEKPEPGREPSNLVNILVHLHTAPEKLLGYIDSVKTTRDDVYGCALDKLVKDGWKIRVVPYADFWMPIKYPWHILDVTKHLLDLAQPQIPASATISQKATVEGKVIMGENVTVLENAVIRGPVYIGPNCLIGTNALIREYSHIGADCVIGYCTEVKGSYIGDGCWFHSSYIGDSIIGKNCSFGAGTILANFRFDEQSIAVSVADEVVDTGMDKLGAIVGDDCMTGVNVSIMPGTRIGPNSIVGSHVCLTKDLGPDKMILAEPHYRIVPNPVKSDEAKRKELRKNWKS